MFDPLVWRMLKFSDTREMSEVNDQCPWLTYMLKTLMAEITDLCQGIHRIIHHYPVGFILRMQDWFTTMKGIDKHFKRLHLQIWSFKPIAKWALIKQKRGIYSFMELIKDGESHVTKLASKPLGGLAQALLVRMSLCTIFRGTIWWHMYLFWSNSLKIKAS